MLSTGFTAARQAARDLAAELAAHYGLGTTGRRWRRPAHSCPWWCARDHRCTAQPGSAYPSGEHRSAELQWTPSYGLLQTVRAQTVGGQGKLRVLAEVDLPADEDAARRVAHQLAVGVDLTIRAITTGPAAAGTARPAVTHRLTREITR